jgi:hypothetical protein
VTEIAEKIITNHKEVSYYEKYAKSILAIIVLAYLAVTADTSKVKNPDSLSWMPPIKEILEGMTNWKVMKDFFGREGMWLVVVVTLFFAARRYNNYLDKLELEIYEAEIRKRKSQKKEDSLKKNGFVVESDSSDDD